MQESSILQLSLYQLLARVALLAVLAMPRVRVVRVALLVRLVLQAGFAMPRVRVAVLQARYAMPRVRLVPLARLAPLELLVLLARLAPLELLARLALLLGILMHLLLAGGLLCLAGCRVRHRLGGVWDLR